MKKINTISLFAGCGGLDLGFHQEGFNVVWANDINKDACATYEAWSNLTPYCGDVTKLDISQLHLPKINLILGGFPCQGFSLAGPRKLDDARNQLYKQFIRFIEYFKPEVFLAENVKGLLTLGNGKIFEAILADFKEKGYTLHWQLVNAKNFSVPQDRLRLIMVGIRSELNKTFIFPAIQPSVFLAEVLKSCPIPMPSDLCSAPYSSRYMSRNRVRNWNEVSFTIPAMAKQVPLHPSSPPMKKISADIWEFGKGKTRRFSYKEAACIQTFPQDMLFHGNLDSKYRQIGNAVPVNLSRALAKQVALLF